MTVTPFSPTYPNGTHFSNGVRVGPIYGTTYAQGAPGGNFQSPTNVMSPADGLRNDGVLMGPTYTYFITPYTKAPTAFSAAIPTVAANFLNLSGPANPATFSNCGVATVPLPQAVTLIKGGASTTTSTGYVMDVPRCVAAYVNINVTTGASLIAYGYDTYGFPVVSSIDIPVADYSALVRTFIFPKAMKVLLGVYSSAVIVGGAATISIGTSDVFGLPYRVDNQSCITTSWAELPTTFSSFAQIDLGTGQIGSLVNGTVTGSSVANLAVKGSGSYFSVGIAQISSSQWGPNAADNSPIFGLSASQNFIAASPAPFSNAVQAPLSTATTSDVRGLFAVPSPANYIYGGITGNLGGLSVAKQLVMQMYLPNLNTTKPAVYTDASQIPTNLPVGVNAVVGTPVLVPSVAGGLNYLPGYTPTLPADLYGYPQFNTNVPGTPFSIS